MNEHSNSKDNKYSLREKLIGIGEHSIRKTYYPQLQQQLEYFEEKSDALLNMLEDLEESRKKLEESEERYRLIAENTADTIAVFDMNLNYNYISPAVFNLLGYTPDELMALSLEKIMSPKSWQMIQQIFLEEMEYEKSGKADPNRSRVFITEQYCKDGTKIWVEGTTSFVRDKYGKPIKILAISRNITERKQAEEEHLFHLRFMESLDKVTRAIQGTNDLNQMMNDALETVFSIFACDRAWLFYPCDPDAPSFRVPMEITNSEYPGAKLLNVDVPMPPDMAVDLREALESTDPVTFTIGTEKSINKVSAGQFSVKSMMMIALYPKSGKPWAFGMHQCSYPRIWTKEEKKLFKEISYRISDGLSSLLFLRDLKESEERFRRLAENARDVIYRMSLPDGNYEYVSPAALSVFGYSPEECYKTPILIKQAIHPDWHKYFENQWINLLKGEMPPTYEYQFIHKSGDVRWLNQRNILIQDDEGNPIAIEGIVTDITERKRVEEALSESEKKYRLIAENTADTIWISDLNLNFTYVSPSVEKSRGFTVEEVIAQPPEKSLTPDSIKLAEQILHEELLLDASGQAEYDRHRIIELQQYKKDGSVTWVENTVSFLRDENLKPIGILGISRDISERKLAEAELLERMTRSELIAQMGKKTTAILDLEELLHQTVDLIVETFKYYNVTIFLKEGDYIFLRATTLQFEHQLIKNSKLKIGVEGITGWVAGTGKPLIVPDVSKDNRYYFEHEEITTKSELAVPIRLKGEIIGVLDVQSTTINAFKTIDVTTLQTISDQLAIAIENAMLYESTQIEIAERKRTESELKEYRLHLEDIIKERTKELEKVNKLLQEEIEKQKEAEEKVKQALEKEKELSELKSKFISIASHEFRTPLAVIYSSTELLQRYGRKWEINEYEEQINSIKSNVDHLTDIMDDVLTISRTEVGKIIFKPQPIDLTRLCNNILENVRLICSQFQIIAFNYFPKISTYLLDERLVKYILLNLLSNAVKYSNENGKIKFIVDSDEQNLIFEISDQGIGIPDEDRPFLFEPFHRGINVGEIHGTGLGMSIVKRSVDMHGGSINFVSKVGVGTKFTVNIPIENL